MTTAVLFALLLFAHHAQPAQTPTPVAAPAPVRGLGEAGEYADPEGTYSGFTVCADCSGIGVRLTLKDAAGSEDHGTYDQDLLYIDAPVNGYRGGSKDQNTHERGTWELLPLQAGEPDRKLCLYPSGVKPLPKADTTECYHVVHQTELVFITGFELDHEPNPFPAGLRTLLKVRRLSNGRDYPLLPVDDSPSVK